jgi:hypothetical protein
LDFSGRDLRNSDCCVQHEGKSWHLKTQKGGFEMRKVMCIGLVLLLAMLSVYGSKTIYAGEDTQPCTVSDQFDKSDPIGQHYNVYNNNRVYIGYVIQLNNPYKKWAAYIERSGMSSALFDTKDIAVDAVCKGSRI